MVSGAVVGCMVVGAVVGALVVGVVVGSIFGGVVVVGWGLDSLVQVGRATRPTKRPAPKVGKGKQVYVTTSQLTSGPLAQMKGQVIWLPTGWLIIRW